jgi:hypothetical protein
VEPKDEVLDNLHFKINESEHIFTIQKQIVVVENYIFPEPKYEIVAENKEKQTGRVETDESISK